MTELSVTVSVEQGVGGPRTVVRLVGEADITTPQLGDTLRAEAAKHPRLLLVDASELGFVDSAAIHEIVSAHRKLKDDGGQLSLISPGPEVARILQITGLDTVVPVYATVEEADA